MLDACVAQGVQHLLVEDGRVALDRWQQAPARYALLLTDLRMPGKSGLKVIDLVVERGTKKLPFRVEVADTPDALPLQQLTPELQQKPLL